MQRFLPVCALLICLSGFSWAQFYNKGQEPAKTNWCRLTNKDGVIVIFPCSSDSIALKFSKYLGFSYSHVPNITKPFKNVAPVPAIVHPNSLLSNGFVSWAPKRMEVVTSITWDSDPEPRLKTLAIHETSHVYQVEGLNRGLIKPLTYFFGEQITGASVGFLPLWYIEGDAVNLETALSQGGRGRDASFYNFYRAHLLSFGNLKFSYDKWLLSSYKDYTPNHYQFGYLVVGYINSKYGEDIWPKVLGYVSRNPYTVFPFYFGLKKQTGFSRKDLFNNTITYLDSIWSIKPLVEYNIHNKLLNNDINSFNEYLYPYLVDDSTIISYRKNLSDIPSITLVNFKVGKEQTLFNPGIILGKPYYQNGLLIWSQYKSHPRWEYVNWGELWVMDVKKRESTRISRNTKYINPVFTKDGQILVIEHSPRGDSFIVLLDNNGKPIKKHRLNHKTEPKEIAPGINNDFYVRTTTPQGTEIIYFSGIDSIPRIILGPVYRHISNIAFKNNKLYFTMSQNHQNDVFSVDVETGSTFQNTQSEFGIGGLSTNNDEYLVLTNVKSNGTYPSLLPIAALENYPATISQKVDPLFPSKYKYPSTISADTSITYDNHFTTKYDGVSKLLNFHSWAPVYFNPNDLVNGLVDVKPGFSLYSQNLTSTAVTTLGYSFDETHGFHGKFNWMKWLPVISAGIDIGERYPIAIGGDSSGIIKTKTRIEGNASLTVPLLLTSGEFFTRISPGIIYNYNNNQIWNSNAQKYVNHTDATGLFLNFYSLKRLAHRDLRSSKGIHIFAIGSVFPSSRTLIGPTVYTRTRVYIPGFSKNHSLLISMQYEKHFLKSYFIGNRSSLPRGAKNNYLFGWANGANLDYTFPVMYPDFSIGPLVYIKRIFMNIFADNLFMKEYTKTLDGNYTSSRRVLNSSGLEVYSDCHFFRTRYEFTLGYRIGFDINQQNVFQSFLFTLNLNSIYGFLPNNHIFDINF